MAVFRRWFCVGVILCWGDFVWRRSFISLSINMTACTNGLSGSEFPIGSSRNPGGLVGQVISRMFTLVVWGNGKWLWNPAIMPANLITSFHGIVFEHLLKENVYIILFWHLDFVDQEPCVINKTLVSPSDGWHNVRAAVNEDIWKFKMSHNLSSFFFLEDL